MAMSPIGRAALIVEDGRERRAGVDGLPDAARRARNVEDRRVAFEHGEVVDAPRRRRGPDVAEHEAIERSIAAKHRCWLLHRRGLRVERPGDGDNSQQREQSSETGHGATSRSTSSRMPSGR